MWLKLIIVILFILVVASLTSGLVFLLKDMAGSQSKRTLYALGIRISLASLLLAAIAFGLHTGKLGSRAPWDVNASKAAGMPPGEGTQ
jgi:hypothetical protein